MGLSVVDRMATPVISRGTHVQVVEDSRAANCSVIFRTPSAYTANCRWPTIGKVGVTSDGKAKQPHSVRPREFEEDRRSEGRNKARRHHYDVHALTSSPLTATAIMLQSSILRRLPWSQRSAGWSAGVCCERSQGKVFANLEDKTKLSRSTRSRTRCSRTGRFTGCDGPTGLAIDRQKSSPVLGLRKPSDDGAGCGQRKAGSDSTDRKASGCCRFRCRDPARLQLKWRRYDNRGSTRIRRTNIRWCRRLLRRPEHAPWHWTRRHTRFTWLRRSSVLPRWPPPNSRVPVP